MASIEKRGNNSFRFIAEVGRDADGKRIKRTKTVRYPKKPTNSQLEKDLAAFVTEIESGTYIAPEKMTFADFVELWSSKFVDKELELKTRENYLLHARNRILPYFGHYRIDKIKALHIVEFLDELSDDGSRKDGKAGTLSPASVVYIYRVLRSIFTKAIDWKVIKDNPMGSIKKPKEPKTRKMNVFTDDDVADLFQALENESYPFRMLVTLALTTGLRRGELIALEWKHVNFEKGILEIEQSIPIFKDGQPHIKAPKTGMVRKVSLPQSVVEDLKEYRRHMNKERQDIMERWEGGENLFLFCSWNGKALAPNRPTKWWTSFFERNPQLRHIRFHDLRHTSATLLINQGVHAKIISERLGHSKIATTMDIYGHVIESADQAAASKFEIFLPRHNKAQKA